MYIGKKTAGAKSYYKIDMLAYSEQLAETTNSKKFVRHFLSKRNSASSLQDQGRVGLLTQPCSLQGFTWSSRINVSRVTVVPSLSSSQQHLTVSPEFTIDYVTEFVIFVICASGARPCRATGRRM